MLIQHCLVRVGDYWLCPVCGRRLREHANHRLDVLEAGDGTLHHFAGQAAPADDDETDTTPPPAWLREVLERIAAE